jgi:class 3 adenylate cyclase/predicted ATPase
LFCDLAGSTELSNRLDPEDLRDLVRKYQHVCETAVSEHGGHVAQLLGDGVLVYFGYPTSHEDDSRRAVSAGLAIVERMRALSEAQRKRTGVDLRVRIGIHTGRVVIGEMGGGERTEQLALGAAPNLAARVQGAADLDTVLISASTHRLVRGYFNFEDPRTVELKGFSEPVTLHRAVSETGARTRVEATAAGEHASWVGRTAERDGLYDLWKQARGGALRVVTVSGEAGIGKSRLVHELEMLVPEDARFTLRCQCAADAQHTPYWPLTEMIRRHWMSGVDAQAGLETLAEQVGLEPEAVALIAAAMAVEIDAEKYVVPQVGSLKLREKTVAALMTVLVAPRPKPTLLLVEDLHWSDASTVELLGLLAATEATHGLLAAITHRPDWSCPWPASDVVHSLALARLTPAEQDTLAKDVAGARLPDPVLETIRAKADGVPLFVEEVTKAILESGVLQLSGEQHTLEGEVPADLLPETIQGLLGARLDRTGDAKPVAQLAAVIGRDFSYDLLKAVSPLDPQALRISIDALRDAGLVNEEGANNFVFRHALLRDAAYDSLLKSARRSYHGQVADVLTARFAEVAEARPELVARHYSAAGSVDQALPRWLQAGLRGLQRSAYSDACGDLQSGLADAERLPEGPERFGVELDIRALLGMGLIATQGYAAEAVEANFARAETLSRELGATDDPGALVRRFSVVWGLWSYHIVRGEFEQAEASAERMAALAGPSDLAVEVPGALGQIDFWTGRDFARAHDRFAETATGYDAQKHAMHAVLFNQDPKAVALINQAWASAIMGRRSDANSLMASAIEHAESIAHPFSLAFVLAFGAQLQYFLGDEPRAREMADRTMGISAEHGFPTWMATGSMYHGWSEARRGNAEAGLAELQASLGIWMWLKITLNGPMRAGLLAELQHRAGATDDAIDSLDGALEAAAASGERYFDAELHRLRGAFLLEATPERREEAEADLRRGLDVARHQGAVLWEHRCALSLAESRRDAGDADGARDLLDTLIAGAGESDTAELESAKALLASLA